MGEEKSKYFCEEHLDRAFDDYILENEEFPDVTEAEGHQCDYCEKPAKYKLGR